MHQASVLLFFKKNYMQFYKITLIYFFLSLSATATYAQGCSDAGVCSLNAFKPAGPEDELRNHFKIGVTNGLADYDITVFGGYVEYGRKVNEHWGFDAKMAALGQSGNDISSFGLSDIYLNANYHFSEKTGLTVGTKIPLNMADKRKDGLALPMDYQSSLGTLDLVLGISHEINKLQIVAALQQPLSDNENAFVPEAYPSSSKLREIPSTNGFQRAGDVLLRLSYPLKINDRLNITPSILPIYHLSEDKFLTTNGTANIEGSKGFTLNGNVFVDYRIGEKGKLQLSLASPFIVRESRPDGLTRGYVVGLEYGVRF
jgi:hypothetical protein